MNALASGPDESAGGIMTDETLLPVDNPISTSEQDVLGRATIARDFARSVRELNSSQGVVVGVLGAWGHGKSSFVNLMREQFAAEPELPVVEFNPWVFSGDQQLTDVFFREIAAELRLTDQSKFGIIAERLDKYGDVLSPLALVPWFGGWFDRSFRATRTAAKWWNERKTAGSRGSTRWSRHGSCCGSMRSTRTARMCLTRQCCSA